VAWTTTRSNTLLFLVTQSIIVSALKNMPHGTAMACSFDQGLARGAVTGMTGQRARMWTRGLPDLNLIQLMLGLHDIIIRYSVGKLEDNILLLQDLRIQI